MESQEYTRYRNPVEYLKIFFRRKWLFISPVFAGLVLSIVATFLLPPTYESSTVILVEEEKIINPLIQGLAVSTSVAERMRTLREQILSWNSLVALAKKLNLAQQAQSQAQFEGLILNLRKNIGVQLRGPNLFRLSYFGKKPAETQLVAKTLTDLFIEENMRSQTKETDVAIEFIQEQLKVYKRKIKQSEIAKNEEQLKSLLMDSTEQHPMVKDLKERIAKGKSELESDEYKVGENLEPINTPVQAALQQELDKIIQKAETTSPAVSSTAYGAPSPAGTDPNTAIYKLLLMDKIDSALARDINVNENIYNMLLQKLETAKITQRLEVSKEGTRYSIIDPPRLPLTPTKPNKIMVICMGIFLGAFAGAGLVLGREFMDQSFLDIEDAKNSLRLPVLGAISRITTQEEIDREKSRKSLIIVVSLIVSGGLIIIAMLVSFLKK